MEEYDVLVTETKQYMYNVEANNKEEALKKVYKEYYAMQEQIGIDDSVSVDFEIDGEEVDINFEGEYEFK